MRTEPSALPPAQQAKPDPASSSLGARSPDQLAEMASRDVAVLMQGLPSAPTAAPTAAPAAAPPQETGRTPPPIMWDSPAQPRHDQPHPAVDEAPAAKKPAGDRKEAFVPGPLFRLEDSLETPGASATPAPAALTNDRIAELMVELSRELYRESAYADMPLRELMVIAAQSIARPDRALSAEAIPGLTDRERELLDHFQQFCRQLGDALREAEEPDEVFREQVTTLRNALIDPPRLTIAERVLCYHVEGFGLYERFNKHAFLAHSDQRVILYLEVGDFTSELNQKGQWVTQLSQQLTIYSDRDGIPVWTAEWQPAVDVSNKQRRDFFTVQVITLPAALSVGKYQLKVRLRDEKSGAEAETALEFEMVADSKLAARIP